MSNLNEDEADAFFHQGDAGTYDGGPALSLAPVGMADAIDEDDRPRPLTIEQIARRERLKRLVTTVVGTLGAGSVLLFALRVTRSESETAGAASLGAVSVPNVSRPIAEARATVALPVQVEPVAPPVTTDVAAVVAQPVAEERVAAPTPVAAPKTAEPVPHASPAALTTRPGTSHQLSSERAVARASIFALPSRAASSVGSQGGASRGHTPPTATFPD